MNQLAIFAEDTIADSTTFIRYTLDINYKQCRMNVKALSDP